MNDPFFPMEMLGIVAFAISGAMLAVRKGMDLFGVNILGLSTAVGGGSIRDLVLGITPPQMLRDPTFALVAIATSTIFFAILYFYRRNTSERTRSLSKAILIYTDAIGLGIFAVSGVDTALRAYPDATVFMLLFVALVTGTGGGILRDIMAGEMPSVLVRHVYAVAALLGAGAYLLLKDILAPIPATAIAAGITVIVRGLAFHYKWNFPHIPAAKPPAAP